MAQDNQNEFSIKEGLESRMVRHTARHLPSFFRTDPNKKFLGGTLDPLTQPGKLTRINSYVGRRDIPNYKFDDNYEEEASNARQYYQLEPSFVYDNTSSNTVDWSADYIDYMNSLKYFGASLGNHSNLNKSEAYSWDPNIDWDKFVNYREYYWLPNGPDTVTIYGESESIVSTYSVTSRFDVDNIVYIFSPDGLSANPRLTLYRGQTYKFKINAVGYPFCIKSNPIAGPSYFYNSGVSNQLTENGILEFTVPHEAPSLLFYLNNNDINTVGMIDIKNIDEASYLDVDLTISGKKTFTSSNGIKFINGLKIKFSGKVSPEKYATGEWYVEGVGNKIKLVNSKDLDNPITYGTSLENPFDAQPFDSLPWELAENYSVNKDYIVINRASRDRNIWSRNNRWFHINVIDTTAKANGQISEFNQNFRAIRPIIEFFPNMKLFNYGWVSKQDVDLIDSYTTDVFSTIEGTTGYNNVDGEKIFPGYRILFTADTDPLVAGRIFKVVRIFNSNENRYQITLQSDDDTEPMEGEVVYATKGNTNKGSSYYYLNGAWHKAQTKISINQTPLFDLFDENHNSFSDTTAYPYNNFSGNKFFSYQLGTGSADSELGFPISYRAIDNVGDIVFSFDLQKQSWQYQENNLLTTVNSYTGFVRKFNDDDTFSYTNGWIRTYKDLDQPVIRVLRVTEETNLIPIDVYDNSANLSGLTIRVFVNDKKVDPNTISFETIQGYLYIKFATNLSIDDKVVYKVRSTNAKNGRGYYEIPHNWQNNPLNETVDSFTFGEVIDHVGTIIENILPFSGNFPGISNLANLGYISHYGQRFLQHAGSMPLSAFVMTDKHANVVKALRYTAKKYTLFKKEFIRLATNNSFEGSVAEIVDQILASYSSAKYLDLTAFYYSDMVAAGAASVREYEVLDPRLPVFVIDSIYTPMTTSKRLILVYVNDIQLIYGVDYTFETTDAFIQILSPLRVGDKIKIKDYDNTDGRSYIPYTPSKLGLFPSYIPRIYLDDTYTVPTTVIQGHDGSIVIAYNDYRDDLILELERRIYNSRKVEYDTSIFNLHDVIGGYYRKTDFSLKEINDIMLGDFLRWNSVADLDLISNDYYVEENTFTYNYNRSSDPGLKESLYGYWRGVYKYFYDTDRPHTCPWEMQGFVVKPIWWDTVYGEAPYTNENKIMWDNIEKGLIAEPGKRRINLRYVRTGLSKYIPVDEDGNLLSPLDSNLAQDFSLINATGDYIFSDQSPVETAWRRSSEYPYSVISTICVLRGAEFIGKMWDRFTIKRNIAGQIYSTVSGLKIQPSQLTYPNNRIGNINDPTAPVTVTSGLVNFIEEYLFDAKYSNIDQYKETLTNLDAKLTYRIGGFTSKDQIDVLLDSRSPNATGTVFLPKENYKIFYNKSAPVQTVSYSGVIVEKVGTSYPLWISNYKYKSGVRVSFQGETYHCTTTHVSNNSPNLTSVEKFNLDSKNWNKETIQRIGYKIRGYDNEKNYFEVFGYRSSQTDPTINVGGISESYVSWETSKYYAKDQLVRYNNAGIYRAKYSHTSSDKGFDNDLEKWTSLSKLPIVGGVTVTRRSRFGTDPIKINYGTIFATVQEIVDFLLGYQKRLESWGFSFDDYNKDLDVPLTWLTSAKEFMFWTLQKWAAGSVITLSPAASKITFIPKISASVDNTDTDFYDYSIFKADGAPLKSDTTDIYREGTGFVLKPSSDTTDGIFHIRTNLVYKEHVILFDNISIFNDVLYDKVPGYRQGRLKILGYKTMNWNGSYISPGFMYDPAEINDWKPNTDYMIGDIVKFKSYYFSALVKVLGKSDFEYKDWKQLDSAPVAGLIPNFDYKVEQFRDFYSLEGSNFDSNQEALARHLIGYQPRQYLSNIINDEVAQYKFYQGFIKEKGTLNSIVKLFDVLRASGFNKIDIKEEWAFKTGEYGASDAYTEIEFCLDEQKFLHNPQNINLTNQFTEYTDLSIYNLTANDIAIKPSSYDSKPFKMFKIDPTQHNHGIFKYQVAGYVKDEDVDHIITNEAALLNYDITQFNDKDKIWLGYTSNNDWDVLEYLNTDIIVTTWTASDNIISLICNVTPMVNVDDIIVLSNLDALDGSYKVQSVYNNVIEIYTFNSTVFSIQDNVTSGVVHRLTSSRYASLAAVSEKRYNNTDIRGELIWIDSDKNSKWLVLENQDAFTKSELSALSKLADQKFGYEVKISLDQKWMFVSSVNNLSGSVTVYNRVSNTSSWNSIQTLILPSGFLTIDNTEKFGTSIDVTDDGVTVVISCPNASSLRTISANGLNIGDGASDHSEITNQGIVAIYNYNSFNARYEFDTIIASYDPSENEHFGNKVKLSNDGTNLWLFVCSKNYYGDSGRVQIFRKTNGIWQSNPAATTLGLSGAPGHMRGYDLDCTPGATRIVVSAPYAQNYTSNSGEVFVFERSGYTFTLIETINSFRMVNGEIPDDVKVNTYLDDDDYFGYSVAITNDYLFVSAPGHDAGGINVGAVYKFSAISGTTFNSYYKITQLILPPIITANERFGTKLSINSSSTVLAISAIGGSSILSLGFDGYADRLSQYEITVSKVGNITSVTNVSTITGISSTEDLFVGMSLTRVSGTGRFGGISNIISIDSATQITVTSETANDTGSITFSANGLKTNYVLDTTSTVTTSTTFDNSSTLFYDSVPVTGAVYVYNAFDDNFIFGDSLRPDGYLLTDDSFGFSVATTNVDVVIGTPNRRVGSNRLGTVFTFNFSELSWKIKQAQEYLVDISKFKKAFIYDTNKNTLIETLDFYDPAKGRIPAVADQEIKYQTYYDPAVYQYGVPTEVSVDESAPWTDTHVGEVWWDISKVKYTWYEQGDSTYRTNNWGRIFTGSTIDIYEWVESIYLPSKWAELADTEEGIALGISGIPKDIDNFTWSSKYKYDPISGTKTTLYYYWVKSKTITPNVSNRYLSCFNIANLILDPKSQGYHYVSITNDNSLSLTNIGSKLIDEDIALNLQFYEIDNTELLTHREYVLIAKDDKDAIIPPSIEHKWFDSLIGSNIHGQPLPDMRLNKKQRYGNLNSPRQSWFINRFEALKQLFEYVNSVLEKNSISDDISFTDLMKKDLPPNINSGDIDQIIDVIYEFKFIGTRKFKTASISLTVKDGKIDTVKIEDAGYGYGLNQIYDTNEVGDAISWYGPNIKINGTGHGAYIQLVIDSQGRVINALIIKAGSGYDSSTKIIVRDYTVLVNTDEDANNGWSLYTWDRSSKEWNRTKTQAFDVTRYWEYKDWYETDYGLDSDISFLISRTVDLNGLDAKKGDIVKINNVGYGSWLLLERIAVTNNPDFTNDYRVVGKQNGTIKFLDNIYNFNKDIGFDTTFSFDLSSYDQGPTIELRIILETLRDVILVNNLREEYIKSFFNSVYYVLSEQLYTDWCFKTSFLKAIHSVGTLTPDKPRITFQSDELESYESFLEEAKPYKTKIREWVSSYEGVDKSNNVVSDFDLPAYYNLSTNTIEVTTSSSENISLYPWKNWLENYTYYLTDIIITDPGKNYTTTPIVIISGGGGTGAKASAYVSNGTIYKIVIDNPGYGFTSNPIILISGGNGNVEANRAKAYAKIGNSLVRSNLIGIKFDRYTNSYVVDQFKHTDTFTGTGSQKKFKLTFAPDLEKSMFTVVVDHIEYYGSQFNISLTNATHDTYTALEGYITFTNAPISNSNITVTYYKNIRLYTAADRINYAYNPKAGQYGKDLGQLMTGVDYGGVTFTSIDFNVGGGWDVLPWDVTSWDNVLSSNDDYVARVSGYEFSVATSVTGATTYGGISTGWVLTQNSQTQLIGSGWTVTVPGYNTPFTITGSLYNNLFNGWGVTTFPIGISNLSFPQIFRSPAFTRSYTLPYIPEVGEVINIYLNDIRIDDNDILNSFIGDGLNDVITIPIAITLTDGDLLTFRKSTSDGAVLPTDRSVIDSIVSGGNFTYSSATGFKAEDIVVDGDGFITPDTSHGPEELVQGHLIDTLNIRVYNTPSSGGPNIKVNNYIGDGINKVYHVNQLPGTDSSVIALVDGVSVDFTINFIDQTVAINNLPAVDSQITIIIFDTAGYDILDKLVYIGDGNQNEFLTGARYSKDNVTAFITVNGVEYGATILASDSNYTVSGNAVVILDETPPQDSIIQIMVFSGNIKKYSKMTTQNIPIVYGYVSYDLDPVPAVLGPLSACVFVSIDGEYLAAPDYENYIYDGGLIVIDDPNYLPYSLTQSDVNVYCNGIQLDSTLDYQVDPAENSVQILSKKVKKGNDIIVEILKKNDYQIINDKLILTNRYKTVNKNMIKVTVFTNHDVVKTKRSNKGFKFTVGYDIFNFDTTRYDIVSSALNTNGIFDLPRTVTNTSGVFVTISHKLLSPNIDYIVLDNRKQIKVRLPQELTGNDFIEIITTNEQTVRPSFGFNMFKDMLNRTSYKALDKNRITNLAEDLKLSDLSIVVVDGSKLPNVNNTQTSGIRIPGVIDINGERIEYFVKNGNVLSQLRRATLGTSSRELVSAGAIVYDMGTKLTLPYVDTEVKKTAIGNGIKKVFDLDFVPRVTRSTIATNNIWYRDTIPSNFGQCDEIEVFVGGRRLVKVPTIIYDQNLGQDSYKGAGDKKIEAEFSVNNTTKSVRLTKAPNAGEMVVIISKRGRKWQNPEENTSLIFSNTNVAKFLNTKQVDLPK